MVAIGHPLLVPFKPPRSHVQLTVLPSRPSLACFALRFHPAALTRRLKQYYRNQITLGGGRATFQYGSPSETLRSKTQ